MSDDRIDEGLHAYADQVQRAVIMASAQGIRRRAAQRRQRRITGAAFTVVLGTAIAVGVTIGNPRSVTPTTPSASPASGSPTVSPSRPTSLPPSISPPPTATSSAAARPTRPTGAPTSTRPSTPVAESDVSQLKELGIDLDTDVLIDVPDDGVDRFLQIKSDGVVDFTGTTRTDSTTMSLRPARVRAENRVVIVAPSWRADQGDDHCVADTTGAP
jgi:hypothetical protein